MQSKVLLSTLCPYMSRDKAVLGKLSKSGHKAALCPALCLKGTMSLSGVARKSGAAGLVPLDIHMLHGDPPSSNERVLKGSLMFWDGAHPGGKVCPTMETPVLKQVWPPQQVRLVSRSCRARRAPIPLPGPIVAHQGPPGLLPSQSGNGSAGARSEGQLCSSCDQGLGWWWEGLGPLPRACYSVLGRP